MSTRVPRLPLLELQMAARLRTFDEHLIEHGCAGWTCTERDDLEDAHDAAVRAWALRPARQQAERLARAGAA